MNITEHVLEQTTGHIPILLEFAEMAGVTLENMIVDYAITKNRLTLTSAKYSTEENIIESVTIELELYRNKISVIRNLRREFDIKTIGNDPITNHKEYTVNEIQSVTEFHAGNGHLAITNASVSQTTKEDSRNMNYWMSCAFATISDFYDEQKRNFLADGYDMQVAVELHPTPKDYQIMDGLGFMEKNSHIKQKKVEKKSL